MSELMEASMDLHHRLDSLRAEHRELDETITRMFTDMVEDDLAVRRLKKRKLVVKDRISLIERMMSPETHA